MTSLWFSTGRTHTGTTPRATRSLLLPIVVALSILLAVPADVLASPGAPDGERHPYVGMIVTDLGDGHVVPSCHLTLTSATQAVTAHHCAPSGSQVSFTLDNPVTVPARIHTGTVRMGGFDWGAYDVDVALVDLDEPIELPRYAQLPAASLAYGPGTILDYVTYINLNRAALFGKGLPADRQLQHEPAPVEFDRNLIRTTSVQGPRATGSTTSVATMNMTCFGSSGSPMFPKGTDVVAGVLSWGSMQCLGGGDSHFARTDSELALGILTGTLEPPPPPAPETAFPFGIRESGTSGATTFPATIVPGATYTASVSGLSPASQTIGSVAPDDIAVFSASVAPGFRYFVAALDDTYTSGNDDLDLYLTWEIAGQPSIVLGSMGCGSTELVGFSDVDLEFIAEFADDPNHFEVWVHGYATDAPSSDFTLFTLALEPSDAGNLTVDPTVADADDPDEEIGVSWSGLDPVNLMYFGVIDHLLDGVPEPSYRATLVQIDTPG